MAVQMPAMKVAPLLDDPQAIQVMEVIGDDIEPHAEATILEGTMAGYRKQCDVGEIFAVSSDEASNDEVDVWQVTDSEADERRGQLGPSPIPRGGMFVSHFDVGAPLSGTAHRGQVQAVCEGQPGAGGHPRAQVPLHKSLEYRSLNKLLATV